jgi:hypothetical protein
VDKVTFSEIEELPSCKKNGTAVYCRCWRSKTVSVHLCINHKLTDMMQYIIMLNYQLVITSSLAR